MTQYDHLYARESYYWGTKPAAFLDSLIALRPPGRDTRVLDIGCGEGKDAVYLATKGYTVSAFDLSGNGIRKAQKLAAGAGVSIDAFVADLHSFQADGPFDILYSSGTIQYLRPTQKQAFFERCQAMTRLHGLHYFNVFVDKPFLPPPPDLEPGETLWKTGELFSFYADWKIHLFDEVLFADDSGGQPHVHCMDVILAEKMCE